MQLVHFNPERYTMMMAQRAAYSAQPSNWDTSAKYADDLENDPGVPFDPGTFVELARQAGAKDLAAAFARCTWVWHPGGGVLSFVPLERWGDGTPLGEEVLMHHPTQGTLVVQLQQDDSVPEGIRIYFMERVH